MQAEPITITTTATTQTATANHHTNNNHSSINLHQNSNSNNNSSSTAPPPSTTTTTTNHSVECNNSDVERSLNTHTNFINGFGDNIITISTTQINELIVIDNSDDSNHSETIIKTPKSATTISSAEKIVKFLSKKSIADISAATATAKATAVSIPTTTNPTASARKRKFCRFCAPSQCVSFQENIADVHHRKGRRLHGLQLPLHPLQIFGWLVLILFGIATYCILIPAFTHEIQGPLYGLITGLYIVHVVSHLTALLLDPADNELRRVHRNDRIVPEFDRSKHTHVIENGRCHLCNIRTSSQRTKHCSVCNKCVGKFDHHCKWLNHCIGSRNYVAFLMCVVSAVIATLVIVAAVIAQLVLYYVQPEWLSFWYASSNEEASAAASASADLSATTQAAAENIALLINNGLNSSLNDTLLDFANVTIGAVDLSAHTTNDTLLLLAEEDEGGAADFINATTLPTLVDKLSTLISSTVNESSVLSTATTTTVEFAANNNQSTTYNLTTNNSSSSSNNTVVTIAGIGLNDTIFLALIGILGLLAAITAGLLLHLCFFHIYISFLGLTTYEYIRNHRQAQEAKAKGLLSTLPNATTITTDTRNPSKKTNNNNNCGQIYFCSSLRNPNTFDANERRYFEAQRAENTATKPTRLHCCANSREYHQTALKTYYMCSLLEEDESSMVNNMPLSIAHISGNDASGATIRGKTVGTEALYDNTGNGETEDVDDYKTFHCCSTFAATTTQRKVSAATTKATLVSDLEAAAASLSARRSYLQFTEQCTFCTFRIRSPIVGKRQASATSTRSNNSLSNRLHPALKHETSQVSKSSSAVSNSASAEHQRCCMKAISKHQRWRRKWNCCSSVPDSPDVPNDIIAALAVRHQHETNGAGKKLNATEIPVQFIRTVNGGNRFVSSGDHSTSPRNAVNLKAQTRTRNARTWPVARLRHMMRMFNRYRRPRCRHHNTTAAAVGEQIKQNQIRPLQLQNNTNGCQHHYTHQQQNYYDSSSPQPASSTTNTTPSERSSDISVYSDTSAAIMTTSSSTAQQANAIETILPTSVIRDNTCMTYTTPVGIILPPALPPPTRRKIPNPTDLQELAETLGFASHPSSASGGCVGSSAQRLPALNNVYRRQRRKHFLRTRSPTLSPIHESGLSNPTSPQPCRHNISRNSSPSLSTKTAAGVGAAGTTNAAAGLINNICGSTELMRKTSSNNSLHSISSSSSST